MSVTQLKSRETAAVILQRMYRKWRNNKVQQKTSQKTKYGFDLLYSSQDSPSYCALCRTQKQDNILHETQVLNLFEKKMVIFLKGGTLVQ